MSSIEKSALVRRQEAQLTALEQQLKQVRKTIKSLKTRLENTQNKIRNIQQEVFSNATKLDERMRTAVEKIKRITKKLKADHRLDPELRSEISQMVSILFESLGIDGETLEEQLLQQAKAREKAQSSDAFAEFRVALDKQETKDLRKLYLELSKQFHPDKARSTSDEKHYRALQQQIIEAYERGDYQALLDLQNLYQIASSLEQSAEAETTDALAHKITIREQQLHQLELQKERLSQEVKALRKSDLGQMLTGVDGMARHGFSLKETMGITQMEEMVETLERYYDVLVDTDRLGYLSPKFQEFFPADGEIDEELLDDFFAEMGMNPTDALGLFDDELDDEGIPNPNPKFKVGSLVELTGDFQLDLLDDLGDEYYEEGGGLSGTVEEALLDEKTKNPIYSIRLDSRSLHRLSPDYCQTCLSLDMPLDMLFSVPEKNLRKKVKKRRETQLTQMKAAQKLKLKYQYHHLETEQFQLLEEILLSNVELDEVSQWLAYLEKHFTLPLKVRTLEAEFDWQANQPATIYKPTFFDMMYGLMVEVKVGRQEYEAPLMCFTGKKGTHLTRVLNLYRIWAETELGTSF